MAAEFDYKKLMLQYMENPLFRDADANELILGNPYRRPVRVKDACNLDLDEMLETDEQSSLDALICQRILTNIYESDLVLLPTQSFDQNFDLFYDQDTKVLGEVLRPKLEKKVFGFLERLDVPNVESLSALKSIDIQHRDNSKSAGHSIFEAIRKSSNPATAFQMLAIQLAPDYLSEASAMARNVLGSFGPQQSELFKVLIDEYGCGVHEKKHSTMYARFLTSVGLSSEIHAYWQFYLPSSLALNNYFHYISKDHRQFFRYIGALYFTEVALVEFCRGFAELATEIHGDSVDVSYFVEHQHIDKFHGDMAFEKIVNPLIEKYGDRAFKDIVRGFFEFAHLQELADSDFIEQVRWVSRNEKLRSEAKNAYEEIQRRKVRLPIEKYLESAGECSTTHIHDEDKLLVIESGEMLFWNAFGVEISLKKGDVFYIPANRLHGSVVNSGQCRYLQPVLSETLRKEIFGEN